MKPLVQFLSAVCLLTSFASSADAAFFQNPKPIDWADVKHQPAIVHVEGTRPEQLAPGSGTTGWAKVPDNLKRLAAVVQMPLSKHLGVAEYRVSGSGWAIIACNWDYQGNQSGDWKKEALSESNLISQGWRKLSEAELGGRLVKGDGRVQTVFIKKLERGEEGRLRCNKYDPPFFIVGSAVAGE